MQRGYGDEDYSAIARKYFGATEPAGPEEVGLELFEKPAPVEPYPFTSHETKAATPVPIDTVLPSPMESAAQDLVPNPDEPVAPVDAPQEIEPLSGSHMQDQINGESAETTVQAEPAAQSELKEEEPSRRGILSRLLRRNDY
jgi:hypothetical protein